MRIIKSIQFKVIISIIIASAISVFIVHGLYQTWFSETEEQMLRNKLRRVLHSYTGPCLTKPEALNSLLALTQRYDLDGLTFIDAETGSEIISFGNKLPLEPLRKQFGSDLHSNIDKKQIDLEFYSVKEKQNTLYGFRRITGINNKPFILSAAAVNNYAVAVRQLMESLSWITISGSILVALMLSYFLRHIVMRPIYNMSKAIQQVGSGNYSQKMDTDIDYELISLAESYNSMVEELGKNYNIIQEYQHSLEDKVKDALGKLKASEDELAHAEKLAGIGQLAAGVAHEINNPLYHILLTADLVKDDISDSEVRERLNQLIEQAKRCRKIVNDLLQYSRQEGEIVGSFDLLPVLQESLEQFDKQGQLADIESTLDCPQNLPQIFGSREDIRRVIDNVVNNAIQAIQEKGIIDISVKQSEKDIMSINIRDNGCGMSEKVKKHAFDAFFTTKDVGQGTGLGLSISYGTIVRHKGKIELESEPGKGTTVKITLPAVALCSGYSTVKEIEDD
ncbi:MAG: sensor histidine kinase [Planctomycetota bacterium]|jgi:signal transduction histidine kinase